MPMKNQCDDHGCSELLCGCHISVLEGSSDFHEILRAKNKWINQLLNAHAEMKTAMLENGIFMSQETKNADIPPEDKKKLDISCQQTVKNEVENA